MIVLVSKDLHLYCIWSWRKVMSGITYSMYRPSIFTVKNEFSTPRFWIQSFSWFCWPPTWCVAAFPSHSRLCLSSIASLVDGLPSTFGSLQIHWNFSSSSYSFHCWRFIALKKKSLLGEQDGGGVGGCGVHLSPGIHQEHIFRHRNHAEHQLRVERRTWPVEKNI